MPVGAWSVRPHPRWAYMMAAAAASLSCLRLHEDDIFWQLRAGAEILHSRSFSDHDTWSYTVQGAAWLNYQWLSELLFYAVHAAGGVAALIALRVVLFLALYALLILLARTAVADGEASPWLAAAMPLLFLCGAMHRLHLRPETLGLLCYAGVLLLPGLARRRDWSARWRRAATVGLVLLACQWHTGTALFTVLAAVYTELASRGAWRTRLLMGVGYSAALLCTPLGAGIVPALLEHASYDNSVLFNTEWQSFSWRLLDPAMEGLTFVTWVAVSVAALVTLAFERRASLEALGVLGLTALACYRIRFIPYQIIFVVPALARAGWLTAAWRPKAFLATALVITGIQAQRVAPYLGLGVSTERFSPRVLDFVGEHALQGRLFTTFELGSYQLFALPEYPVFADPRDVIYAPVKADYVRAFADANAFQELVRRYAIEMVVIDYPLAETLPDGQSLSAIDAFLPPSQWAVLAFDSYRALWVRRDGENREAVQTLEYHALRLDAPPAAAAFAPSESEATLAEELSRCLSRDPTNAFCLVIQYARRIKAREDLWHTGHALLALGADQPKYRALASILADRAFELAPSAKTAPK